MYEILAKLRSKGFLVDKVPIDKGIIIRCPTQDKPRKKNGSFIIFNDKNCWFNNWATEESGTFLEKGYSLTKKEREKIQLAQEEAKKEREEMYAKTALKAVSILARLKKAEKTPYTLKKGVKCYDVFCGRNNLILPLRDVTGKIWSLQTIYADGNKRFLTGGKKKGCFHKITGTGKTVLCEGYATGASIHEATGYTVIVCFDAGNLLEVSKYFKDCIIAADNDAPQKNQQMGIGELKAKATGRPYVMPDFLGMDFNDVHNKFGLNAVKKYFEKEAFLSSDDFLSLYSFPMLEPAGKQIKPLHTIQNLEHLLKSYGISCRYNEIKKRTEIDGKLFMYGDNGDNLNAKFSRISSLCIQNKLQRNCIDFLDEIAKNNRFNPVLDWIKNRTWDGTSRLVDLFSTVMSSMDEDFKNILMKKWLLSCVASLVKKDFISHGVLVFVGGQGIGKTSWFRHLVPQELRDLILEGHLLDPSNKDNISYAITRWLVELGELDGTFKKSDIAKIKSFVTQPNDVIRMPYARTSETYKRQTVFFASVNEEKFLVDETGNRRWWTIPVTEINYSHSIDMQQIFAELLFLLENGAEYWLTKEEQIKLNGQNEQHNKPIKAENEVQDILHYCAMHAEEFVPAEMTVTHWKEQFDSLNKYSSEVVSKVLNKLEIKHIITKRIDGKLMKLRNLWRRKGI